jgi:hypothetical protein
MLPRKVLWIFELIDIDSSFSIRALFTIIGNVEAWLCIRQDGNTCSLEFEKKISPYNRPCRPIGLRDVWDPRLSRQSAHRWRWGGEPYAQVDLYLQKDLLVFISVRGWINAWANSRLEGFGKFKTISGLITTWNRNVKACNAWNIYTTAKTKT